MKKCYTCKIVKDKCEYSKHNQKKDGLDPNCKSCRSVRAKKYYQDNSDMIKSKRSDYYEYNKEKCIASNLKWQNKTEKNNTQYKLARRLRNRLYYALKKTSWKKNTHFSEYIGCSKQKLVMHLESLFTNKMTWENYGEWHIDHIIPLSSAKSEDEMYKLCHYSNLQPLWAVDNIKKGNRIARFPIKRKSD